MLFVLAVHVKVTGCPSFGVLVDADRLTPSKSEGKMNLFVMDESMHENL